MRQAYRGVHSSSAFAFWVPAAFVFSQTPADDGEGLLLTVIALDVVNGRIQAIRSVANPNTRGHLGPTSSYGRTDPVERTDTRYPEHACHVTVSWLRW